MKYERTDVIKNKQSNSMKIVHKNNTYDWVDIEHKRKETYQKKGTKPGRKPGDGPKRKGEYKPCPVCGADVYHTPKNINENRTKCCSRVCLMNSPEYKKKLSAVDRSYLQTDEYKERLKKPTTKLYKRYRNEVTKKSEKTYVMFIDILNPDRHPRTLAGVNGGWQLDHIKPVRECYECGLTPEEASSIDNLRMLPWRENVARNKK